MNVQESAHPEGHDYAIGSPHLKHDELRGRVERSLTLEVSELRARYGQCRVLEIGAGHGSFTHVLRAAGADVTVTEMSRPSVSYLVDRFRDDAGVNVIHDSDGTWCKGATEKFHLVVAVSVLHHIPDYVGAVRAYAMLTQPGGSFLSWQDPLWYARLPRLTLAASNAAYIIWRVGQGNLVRGLATRARRLRGHFDETNPSDMSEYHVVREGVDEQALASLLQGLYHQSETLRYWSTQASPLQWLGDRLGLVSSFAMRARGRLSDSETEATVADA